MQKNVSSSASRVSAIGNSEPLKAKPVEATRTHEEEIARLKKENAQLRGIRGTLEASIKSRFSEIAQLTRLLQHANHVSDQIRASTLNAEGTAPQGAMLPEQVQQAFQLLAQRSAMNAMALLAANNAAGQARGVMGLLNKRQRKDTAPYTLAIKVELIKASGLFDSGWYLSQYEDVRESGNDPAEHYLTQGAAAGKNPGPLFDVAAYLQDNPDVADSKQNPLLHYIVNGSREGRFIKIVKE